MFPLRDDNPALLTPAVTIVLILANVVVWLYVQGVVLDERARRCVFTEPRFGFKPSSFFVTILRIIAEPPGFVLTPLKAQ